MTDREHRPVSAVLTVEEVAELLRIGRAAAYQGVRQGTIPSIRLGRTIRVPRAKLLALLGEQEQE
jgi:excisionase family DNA binding protein